MLGLSSCGTRCSVICCRNLSCEAKESSSGSAAPDSSRLIMMDVGVILVDHRIRPDTVSGCDVQRVSV